MEDLSLNVQAKEACKNAFQLHNITKIRKKFYVR